HLPLHSFFRLRVGGDFFQRLGGITIVSPGRGAGEGGEDDGRDTPPRSAEASLKKFEDKFAALGKGRVASIVGRYYAMDRDNRW
ncbi:hypothetical protein ONQ62_28765, partial [Salmonella enterica subsp. enterica serovar Virginia]|nr:hypothetical protein [Salmonella enterica subsp. enterica serovar Virginia]